MSKHWLVVIIMMSLVGCISKEASLQGEIDHEVKVATQALKSLKTILSQPTGLVNATILRSYANQIGQIKPSLADAGQTLAKNADPTGPMVRGLERRLSQVAAAKANSVQALEEQLVEVIAIKEAAHPDVFNDALADSVNVLADLSDGQLSRVQAISQREQATRYGSAYAAPGAQLIGNPQYGSWEPAPGGGYIWTWLAAYWFFDEVLDLDDAFETKHYRYGHWSRHRPYSYYHDHGRLRYTSSKVLKQQNRQDRAMAAASQRHRSPYAKTRPGGGTVSLASRTGTQAKRSARSASPYAFSNSSSSRRGASRTSRGPRSGK